MLFAVAGVTGNTGKVVADTLLSQGHAVRVIVRDAAKGEAFAARGAEVAVADLGDAAALTAALTGVDGAWLLIPPNMGAPDFRAYQKATGEALVAAVAAAAVPHVVLLSSVGAHLPSGTGPIAALYPVEAALSKLPATGVSLLRAGYFMENLPGNFGMLDQGLLVAFHSGDLAIPMVATRDIGATAAALLVEGPPAPGHARVVELSGLDVTFHEVAGTLSTLLGRSIAVNEVPTAAMSGALQGFGVPAGLADLYQEMTTGMVSGALGFEGGHRRVIAPTTVEQFLAGFFAR